MPPVRAALTVRCGKRDGGSKPVRRQKVWGDRADRLDEAVGSSCDIRYVVGDHPQALVLMKLKPCQIPEGHEFYHYMIDGNVYAGTFVGKEST